MFAHGTRMVAGFLAASALGACTVGIGVAHSAPSTPPVCQVTSSTHSGAPYMKRTPGLVTAVGIHATTDMNVSIIDPRGKNGPEVICTAEVQNGTVSDVSYRLDDADAGFCGKVVPVNSVLLPGTQPEGGFAVKCNLA